MQSAHGVSRSAKFNSVLPRVWERGGKGREVKVVYAPRRNRDLETKEQDEVEILPDFDD